MTRYRTTQEWADKYACGRVFTGTLLRVLDPEELGYWQDRTKTLLLRLDKPIGNHHELRFAGGHLELIERAPTSGYADAIAEGVLVELRKRDGFNEWWWNALSEDLRDEIENDIAVRIDSIHEAGQ